MRISRSGARPTAHQPVCRRHGLSRVELLVAAVMCLLLVGIGTCGILAGRDQARVTACKNLLRQVGLALEQTGRESPPRREFRELLPYLEQFSQSQPGEIPASTVVHAFHCPAETSVPFVSSDGRACTSYAGVAGDGSKPGFYAPGRVFTRLEVRDGPTFAIGELDSRAHDPPPVWDDTPTALCLNGPNSRDAGGRPRAIDFGSRHRGVTHFVMVDGHVRSVRDDFRLVKGEGIGESFDRIDLQIYRALATVNGQESMPEW